MGGFRSILSVKNASPWEAAEKKGTNAGKAVKVKKAENGKAKRKTQKKADQASAPEKKKESFGQMSLFDLQQ